MKLSFYIFSIISPAFILIKSIKGKIIKYKRSVLTLLIILYGTTLPLSVESDGYAHRQMVIDEYLDMSIDRFLDDFIKILTFQISSSSTDIYKHIISFISGSLLQLPGLFFLFVSIIYGYFYSGVLVKVFKNFTFQKYFHLWFFVLLFFFNKGVEGVQTVRTWTGLWILFYASFSYFETKKVKYAFLMLVPPFIHFGYFLMALPAYAVTLLGNRNKLYTVLFVLSSVTTFIDLQSFGKSFGNFALVDQKLKQYGEEEKTSTDVKFQQYESQNKDKRWYKILEAAGVFNMATTFLIYTLLFLRIPTLIMNNIELKLFNVGLLTLAGSNVFFFIRAASNRMAIIGLAYVTASMIMLIIRTPEFKRMINEKILYRSSLNISMITVLPKFIYSISFFLSQMSLYFLFLPFIPLIDSELNISIIDFIKKILLLK